MSIFDRIRRITKANVNWLLDKVEPAEQELESRIKELEETIQQGRESAALYGATFRRLEGELDQLRSRQTQLSKEAETSLNAGDEGAARRNLTEKIKLNERIAQLEPGILQGRKTYEQLRANICGLQEQLKSARLKMQDLKARQHAAQAQKMFDQTLSKTVSISGPGAVFERLEDEVLQSEAEVQIRQEMQSDGMNDFHLAQRSRDLQVEAELQAMKEKMEKKED